MRILIVLMMSVACLGDEVRDRAYQAWLMEGRGRLDTALTGYRQTLISRPTVPSLYLQIADAYAGLGQHATGEAYFRERVRSGQPLGWLGLMQLASKRGEVGTGRTLLWKCATSTPAPPYCLYYAVARLQPAEAKRMGLEALLSRLNVNPTDPNAVFVRYAWRMIRREVALSDAALDESIHRARELGEQELLEFFLMARVGRHVAKKGGLNQAWADLDKAKGAAAESFDFLGQAGLAHATATLLTEEGRWEEARTVLNREINKAIDAGHADWVGIAHHNLANWYEHRGDWVSAVETRMKAGELRGGIAVRPPHEWFSLSESLRRVGRLRDARIASERGLEDCRRATAVTARPFFLRQLGQLYQQEGDAAKALEYGWASVRDFQSQGMPWQSGAGLGILSYVYASLGDWPTALRLARDSHRSAWGNEDLSEATRTTIVQGDILWRMGRKQEARSEYERALTWARRAETPDYTLVLMLRVAETLLESRDLPGAQLLLRVAEQQLSSGKDPLREAELLRLKALFLGRSGMDAEAQLLEALKASERSGNLRLTIQLRTEIAGSALQRGDSAAAWQFLQPALAAIERVRSGTPSTDLRVSYLRENAQAYELAVRALAEMKGVRRALEVAEQARGRALADILAEARSTADLPKPATAEQMQAEAGKRNCALVQFAVGATRSYMWVVSAQGIRMMALPGRAAIQSLVDRVRAAVGRAPSIRQQTDKTLREAYRRLWIPAAGEQSVVVVPDGPLNYLPFEALVDAQGDYVVEKQEVAYAPSASVWRLLDTSPSRAQQELLALGDPAYPSVVQPPDNRPATVQAVYRSAGFSFRPLPNTRMEVQRIGRLFEASRRTIWLGKAASEASLKATELRSYKRLHFAAHAILDERAPQRSGIVLSLLNKKNDDGILRVHEVFRLKLDASVVVLSACQTGLGKAVRGEGIMGLTRAFLSAGARNVVVTLWDVNDATAPDLMVGLYKGLREGKSVSRALTDAKRDYLKSGRMGARHPHYWAAFIAVGGG